MRTIYKRPRPETERAALLRRLAPQFVRTEMALILLEMMTTTPFGGGTPTRIEAFHE